ncbi:MAG: AMIN domain-containing protein, partial [Roseateles sp.]
MLFLLAAVSIAVVVATPLPAAAGAAVSAVRYWTAPDHTRVVVDLTAEASYSTQVLTDPDRVVVLIAGGSIGDAQVATPVANGLVDRVRLNQLKSGTQVVVDLVAASSH